MNQDSRVKSMPKDEHQKAFKKGFERMKLCVKFKGEYFEHLIK
jgi:hypothetical protein